MRSREKEQSAALLDNARRIFVYRSTMASFLECENNRKQLCAAIEFLLGESLVNEDLMREFDGASRGPHFALIVGHARQYTQARLLPCTSAISHKSAQKPELTEWDRDNRDRVLEFRQLSVVNQLVCVAAFSCLPLRLTSWS